MTGKDLLFYNHLEPQNPLYKVIISLDRKGVSSMYRGTHSRSKYMLFDTCKKWDEKANV